MNCVNCTFPLPMPPATHCAHCGAPVEASYGPAATPYPGQFPPNMPAQHTPPYAHGPFAAAPGFPGYSMVAPVTSAPTEASATPAASAVPGSPSTAPNPTSGRSAIWIAAMVIVALIVGEVVGAGLYAFSQHSWIFGGAVSQPTVPAAPVPTTTPGAYHFHDTLQSNANGWLDMPPNCFFQTGGYVVSNGNACPSPASAIGDGTVSVDVTLLQSTHDAAAAGIMFRLSEDQNTYDKTYEIMIGRDGQWAVTKSLDGTTTNLVSLTNSPAIHQGLNVSNTLSVRMTGSSFVFFVNGSQIGAADDASVTQGGFALVAIPGAEAVFSNFDVKGAGS